MHGSLSMSHALGITSASLFGCTFLFMDRECWFHNSSSEKGIPSVAHSLHKTYNHITEKEKEDIFLKIYKCLIFTGPCVHTCYVFVPLAHSELTKWEFRFVNKHSYNDLLSKALWLWNLNCNTGTHLKMHLSRSCENIKAWVQSITFLPSNYIIPTKKKQHNAFCVKSSKSTFEPFLMPPFIDYGLWKKYITHIHPYKLARIGTHNTHRLKILSIYKSIKLNTMHEWALNSYVY